MADPPTSSDASTTSGASDLGGRRLLVAAAGLGTIAASFLPFWETTVRRVTGYGQARITTRSNAWGEDLAPLVPIGVVALGIAGGLALLLIAVPRLRARGPESAALLVLGGIALGAFVAALVAGPAGSERVVNIFFTTSAGPLFLAAPFVAAVPLLAVLLPRRSAGPLALVRLRQLTAVGVAAVVFVGLGFGLQPTSATPAAVGPTGPIPDWRSDPDEPYPFSGPIPPLVTTAVDGVYTRDPTYHYPGGDPPHCVRCPPYIADSGISTLTLEQGRFRMVHESPPWKSEGHYVLSGTRIILFNDPECSGLRGVYRWQMAPNGDMAFTRLADQCGTNQRWLDFTDQTWRLTHSLRDGITGACQPPNAEAAVTDHWPRPSDC
jgi:hypothetical protein